MLCPKCKSEDVRSIVTVDNPADMETYHRYKCDQCHTTFFSVEFEAILNEQFEVAWATYYDHKR